MEIITRQDDSGVIVFTLNGELDLYHSEELKTAVKARIEGGCKKILFNLSGLKYIDSSGVGSVISILQAARQTGGKIMMSNVDDNVKKIFELTNLLKILEICDDEATALARF